MVCKSVRPRAWNYMRSMYMFLNSIRDHRKVMFQSELDWVVLVRAVVPQRCVGIAEISALIVSISSINAII